MKRATITLILFVIFSTADCKISIITSDPKKYLIDFGFDSAQTESVMKNMFSDSLNKEEFSTNWKQLFFPSLVTTQYYASLYGENDNFYLQIIEKNYQKRVDVYALALLILLGIIIVPAFFYIKDLQGGVNNITRILVLVCPVLFVTYLHRWTPSGNYIFTSSDFRHLLMFNFIVAGKLLFLLNLFFTKGFARNIYDALIEKNEYLGKKEYQGHD